MVDLSLDEVNYILFVVKGDLEVLNNDPDEWQDNGDHYTATKILTKLRQVKNFLEGPKKN